MARFASLDQAFANASPAVRAANAAMLGEAIQPVAAKDACIKAPEWAFVGQEKALQTVCERDLIRRGYQPRTKSTTTGTPGCRKWYVHIRESQNNPYTLDLLVMDEDRGAFVEIELKTRHTKFQPWQREFLRHQGPCRKLCWSAEHFRLIMDEWEEDNHEM